MTKTWELEGYHAYFQGKELEDNPYQEPSEAHSSWIKGWTKASSIK
jgi:ribosome modulation factor